MQYAPDLLPYIKEKVDADRARNDQYLLTGSQNLLLAEKVTEVDFVVETTGQLVPVEVKLSATPRPAMAGAIYLYVGTRRL